MGRSLVILHFELAKKLLMRGCVYLFLDLCAFGNEQFKALHIVKQ